MNSEQLLDLATLALDDLKGIDIQTMDVTPLSDITDYMIVCTGRSNRHVKSLAQNVDKEAKTNGMRPISITGLESGEWALVDLGDVIVHVLLPDMRKLYDLESLWEMSQTTR
jgi:ribosome-associated protein